jgi:uncharacterized RDD family membrane protein YckC
MDNQNQFSSQTFSEDLFPEISLQYAGFWQRFGAAFLDGLILMVPNFLLEMIIGNGIESYLLSIVMYWLYHALLLSSDMQATLGKKALGIKVITLDNKKISFGQATIRYFGQIASTLIGYLMMLWDDKSQTLHDKMADTLVVENKPVYY